MRVSGLRERMQQPTFRSQQPPHRGRPHERKLARTLPTHKASMKRPNARNIVPGVCCWAMALLLLLLSESKGAVLDRLQSRSDDNSNRQMQDTDSQHYLCVSRNSA